MLRVRSPSETAPITCTTSPMLSPVVDTSAFRPSPISFWKPCSPSSSTRALKSPRFAAATTLRWPSITCFSRPTICLTANSMLLSSPARSVICADRSPSATWCSSAAAWSGSPPSCRLITRVTSRPSPIATTTETPITTSISVQVWRTVCSAPSFVALVWLASSSITFAIVASMSETALRAGPLLWSEAWSNLPSSTSCAIFSFCAR
ncbi:hypothetical protein ASE08_28890 [Rhizobacter sp. Root16D2]|nr:hypothetical protein ASE08_28890 [Rhizobacter sp. Root16D2]